MCTSTTITQVCSGCGDVGSVNVSTVLCADADECGAPDEVDEEAAFLCNTCVYEVQHLQALTRLKY